MAKREEVVIWIIEKPAMLEFWGIILKRFAGDLILRRHFDPQILPNSKKY